MLHRFPPNCASFLLPALRRAAGLAFLGAVAFGSHACAPTVDEGGHGCPCDDSTYACCNARCVAKGALTSDGVCPGESPIADGEGNPQDAGEDAGEDAVVPISDGSEADGSLGADASEDSGADASEDSGADACGDAQAVFDPSGGVDYADLSGCGLAELTLSVPDVVNDAGDDAQALDAAQTSDGSAPAIDLADTIFDDDTGEVTYAGKTIRGATTSPPGVRDVKSGIAYRLTSAGLAVFAFESLVVPAGASLRVVGSYPVALVSATTMRIDGVVDVRPMSPDGLTICAPAAPLLGDSVQRAGPAGPGGGSGGAGGYNDHYAAYPASAGMAPNGFVGGAAGSDMDVLTPGSGGGHAGGGGGIANADASVVAGGPSYDQQPLDAAHFHGGAGGGGGAGGVFAYGGPGGGGGGAVRLVAAQAIDVGEGSSVGGVDASGCSGGAGVRADGVSAAGGGGAGGAIVIESPVVTLGSQAVLLAAGGGGGLSNGTDTVAPSPLVSLAEEIAHVGGGMPGCGFPSVSGNGSTVTLLDGQAGYGDPVGCGGGGAAGWIRINSDGEHLATSPSAVVSPSSVPAFFSSGVVAFRP